jgi:hypothetical protein
MSGLSRTPGKRVWVHSPPRVRIPPSPPSTLRRCSAGCPWRRWSRCSLPAPGLPTVPGLPSSRWISPPSRAAPAPAPLRRQRRSPGAAAWHPPCQSADWFYRRWRRQPLSPAPARCCLPSAERPSRTPLHRSPRRRGQRCRAMECHCPASDTAGTTPASPRPRLRFQRNRLRRPAPHRPRPSAVPPDRDPLSRPALDRE